MLLSRVIKALLLFILLVILADYILFLKHKHTLYAEFEEAASKYGPGGLPVVRDPDKVLSNIERRLGWIKTDRTSSYVNFSEKKGKGVIRIGCFGASFTYGYEAGDGNDYPAKLQKLFIKNGYKNVEVINFGMPWHGFHQTSILFDETADKYCLDYCIFYPIIGKKLDATFNHAYNRPGVVFFLSFLHSRYILKNDGELELLDPIGATDRERMMNYCRFIPRYMYLRYDYNAPFAILAPYICLFNDKVISNPFYYKKDVDEEMRMIGSLLVRKISMKESARTVFLLDEGRDVSILGDIDRDKLDVLTVYKIEQFPYRAPLSHMSAYGNEYLANQVFQYITDGGSGYFEIIRTHNLAMTEKSRQDMDGFPISYYDDITLDIGKDIFGRFFRIYDKGGVALPGSYVNSEEKLISLVVLADTEKSLLDSVILPLDFQINSDMAVKIRVRNKSGMYVVQLGKLVLFGGSMNFGYISFGKTRLRSHRGRAFYAEDIIGFDHTGVSAGDALELLIDGHIVLKGNVTADSRKTVFRPHERDLIIISPDAHSRVNLENLERSGDIYLTARKGSERTRIPVAGWVKERVRLNTSGHMEKAINKTGRIMH